MKKSEIQVVHDVGELLRCIRQKYGDEVAGYVALRQLVKDSNAPLQKLCDALNLAEQSMGSSVFLRQFCLGYVKRIFQQEDHLVGSKLPNDEQESNGSEEESTNDEESSEGESEGSEHDGEDEEESSESESEQSKDRDSDKKDASPPNEKSLESDDLEELPLKKSRFAL